MVCGSTSEYNQNCVEHTPEFGNIIITYKENPLFSELIIKDEGEGIDKKIYHMYLNDSIEEEVVQKKIV